MEKYRMSKKKRQTQDMMRNVLDIQKQSTNLKKIILFWLLWMIFSNFCAICSEVSMILEVPTKGNYSLLHSDFSTNPLSLKSPKRNFKFKNDSNNNF